MLLHEHKNCEIDNHNMKFCAKCNIAYCFNCNTEWKQACTQRHYPSCIIYPDTTILLDTTGTGTTPTDTYTVCS